jgi:hypothetical protein
MLQRVVLECLQTKGIDFGRLEPVDGQREDHNEQAQAACPARNEPPAASPKLLRKMSRQPPLGQVATHVEPHQFRPSERMDQTPMEVASRLFRAGSKQMTRVNQL